MKRIISVFLALVLSFWVCLPTLAEGELRKGNRGEDVKVIQERLITLGYLSGKADGGFGKQTESAVKDFQEAADLEVTGTVDDATKEKLLSDSAPYKPYEMPQGVTLGMSFDEIQEIYKPLFLAWEKEYEAEADEEDLQDIGEQGWSIEWHGDSTQKTPFLDVDAFGINGIVTFGFENEALQKLTNVQYNYTVLDYGMIARGFFNSTDADKAEVMLKDYREINKYIEKSLGEPIHFYDWKSDDAKSMYGNDYAAAIADEEYSMSDVWRVGDTGIWHVLYYTADDEVIHHIYVEPIDEYNDPEG